MTRKEQVLHYVNRLRVEYGVGEPLDELPKGKRREAYCCPVARAVNGGAAGSIWFPTPQGGETVVKLPMYVLEFIRAFDQGRYPELVEK